MLKSIYWYFFETPCEIVTKVDINLIYINFGNSEVYGENFIINLFLYNLRRVRKLVRKEDLLESQKGRKVPIVKKK